MVIGDSFYWGFYYLGIAKCFDSAHKFWYYNKQVYPESFTKDLLVQDLNLMDEISKNDIIIIVATDNNLRNVGWGFFENLDKAFKGVQNKSINHNADSDEMKKIITDIKTNKIWVEDTKKRAKEKAISLDSALILEAIWQIHMNGQRVTK